MSTIAPDWLWIVFSSVVLLALVLDLAVLRKQGDHEVSVKEAPELVAAVGGLELGVRGPLVVGAARRRGREGARRHQGAGVRHGLSHREVARGGQHLRLPDDLHLLLGAAGLAKARADARHHQGDRAAHRDDPRVRLAHRAVSLGALRVRRLLAAHEHQDVVGGRQGAGRRVEPRSAAPSTANASSRSRTASAWPRPCCS